MSQTANSPKKRLLSALVAASVAFTGAIFLPSQAAAAENENVAEATLEWGIKDSFRNYITGGAKGKVDTIGTTTIGTDAYNWKGGTGTVAADGSSADVSFTGGVHMTGHSGLLDLTITNPRFEATTSTAGNLYVDVRSRVLATGDYIEQKGVLFSNLTLAQPQVTDKSVSYVVTKSAITEEGAKGFAGYWSPGTVLEAKFNVTLPIKKAVETNTALAVDKADIKSNESAALTATVTPAEAVGTVQLKEGDKTVASEAVNNGTAKFNVSGLSVGAHNLVAVFVPTDTKNFKQSAPSAAVTVNVAEAPPAVVYTPRLEVFKADGSTPLGDSVVNPGDTIVVKGSGFDPEGIKGTRPPLAGQPAGAYVAFGQFAEQWKPSTGAAAETRPAEQVRWALTDAAFNALSADLKPRFQGQRITLGTDGTFSWTLTAPEITKGVEGGKIGVYTYPASGAVAPQQELFVPVNLVKPVPPAAETTTTVTVPETAEEGSNVVIKVAVKPVQALGTVEIFVDGTSIGNAVFDNADGYELTTNALKAGEHSVVAKFKPLDDTKYLASESAAAKVTVTAKPATPAEPSTPANPATPVPAAALKLSVSEAVVGDTVEAKVTGLVPGTEVAFELHSTPVALGKVKADANGVATFSFKVPENTTAGTHTVVARAAALELKQQLVVRAKAAASVVPGITGNTGADQKQPAAGAPAAGGAKQLAKTGSETPAFGAIAALALMLAGAVVITRRRSAGVSENS